MAARHPSSYRDPSGFLFFHEGTLYRQVNQSFKTDFDLFTSSGLYQSLVAKKILISHTPVDQNLTGETCWAYTLQPDRIPFISYPYEWCYDMWKDAALLTLEAAKEALSHGMMLKDASAYNVQFHKGNMIFIDSLSFEKWDATPWIAYRQFCEHFFAPLALMHYLGEPMETLFLAYSDGIPLPVAKKALPFRAKFNLGVQMHVHLHATLAAKSSGNEQSQVNFPEKKLRDLFRNLEEAIRGFSFTVGKGTWSGYYDEALQRDDYVEEKKNLIDEWVTPLEISTALDAGANEGTFSELLANKNITVISADLDHYSVNRLYQRIKKNNIANIHPLVMDLSKPSPAIGVNNEERSSFTSRAVSDLVMALALIHHLCIGRNISFEQVATMFSGLGKFLLIEFVPLNDEKVGFMLKTKKNIYEWYTQENFEQAFLKHFRIVRSAEVGASKRTLYLMERYE